jgi:hypothetical protein
MHVHGKEGVLRGRVCGEGGCVDVEVTVLHV